MERINVTIKGISPLLMHRFPLEPVQALEKKSPEEQAEIAAYRHPKTGELYIPGVAIQRCLTQAGTYSKGKGRASLQKFIAAGLFVSPEYVLLGTKEYEIDARPVVISATRGRIIRYRPKLEQWQATFTIDFDERLLSEPEVRKVVDDAGSLVGLLDFRPQCKGPFGRFMVVKWERVK